MDVKINIPVRAIKGLASLCLMILSCQMAIGQRIIVNTNGERIVMFPDGSWRVMESGDSILYRQYLQKSENSGLQGKNIDPGYNGTKAEQEEYLIRQWNELHFNIKALDKKIQNEFRSATNAQFSAAEIFHNAQANKNLIETDRLATISENYEKSIQKLRIAKLNQKKIKKLLDESKKLANVPIEKLKRKINSLRSRYNLYVEEYKSSHQGKTSNEFQILSVPERTEVRMRSKGEPVTKQMEVKTKNRATGNSILLPPASLTKPYKAQPYRCLVRMDTVDITTGMRRIELEPGLFFTHTDPDLRPFFKSKELITCFGKLSKTDAYVYLSIDFQIASSHSQSNFGSLEKGSLLRLRLLNGEYVSLNNLRADRGRIDPYSGNTVFTGQYALGKKEIKMLLSNELDMVRILWSTGYEDYDIYKIDFFKDRLDCLMTR